MSRDLPRTLSRKGQRRPASDRLECFAPRSAADPPDGPEGALLARLRQLARDLAEAGGALHAKRLSSVAAARDLCRARPRWLRALESGGVLWGVELTAEGRRELLGEAT